MTATMTKELTVPDEVIARLNNNSKNKITCLRAVLHYLATEEDLLQPTAGQVYDVFKKTKYATNDPKKDKPYIHQSLSKIYGKKDDVDEDNDEIKTEKTRPSVAVSRRYQAPDDANNRLTLGHLEAIEDLIPVGGSAQELLSLLKDVEEISSQVGGLSYVIYGLERIKSM